MRPWRQVVIISRSVHSPSKSHRGGVRAAYVCGGKHYQARSFETLQEDVSTDVERGNHQNISDLSASADNKKPKYVATGSNKIELKGSYLTHISVSSNETTKKCLPFAVVCFNSTD